MKWHRLPIKQFDDFAPEWDRIGADVFSRAPFLRSIFFRPLLRQFSSGNEVIVAGYENGEPRVAAILQRVGPGIWQTFQPSQLPLGAVVLSPGLDPVEAFAGLLASVPGMAVSLGLTQLDPIVLPRPIPRPRLQSLDYIETAWVEVKGTFDDYWAARGKNLRHNIRKQNSKLAEQGIQARLETFTRPEDVVQVLRDYGALESAGWKASQGTAIHPENAQGIFYREMLEAYCAAGQGRLYRYLLGDRVAAVDLCITSAEALVILKTTYDESVQGLSPAFLMRHAAFGDLFSEGRIRRIEFYGKLMDWHKRWTDESRTLYHVNYHRWDWLLRARDAVGRLRRRGVAVPAKQEAGENSSPAG